MDNLQQFFRPKRSPGREKPEEETQVSAGGEENAPEVASNPETNWLGASQSPAMTAFEEATVDQTEEENEELVVLLEDILPLVPTRCLKAGLHDPELPLRFHVDELSSSIARGRVTVPVSRLAEICPQVFEPPSTVVEDVAIRLPLQKLIEQLGFVEVGPRRPPTSSPKPMHATVAPAHIWVSARPEIVALRSSEFVPLPRPEAADAVNGTAIESVPVPPAHSNGVYDHGEPFSSHEPAAPAPAHPSVEEPAFEKAPEPAALPVMAEGGASIQVTLPLAPLVSPVSRAGSLSDADSKPDLQPEPVEPAESSSVSGENGAEVPVTALAETCVAYDASEVEVAVPVDVTVPREAAVPVEAPSSSKPAEPAIPTAAASEMLPSAVEDLPLAEEAKDFESPPARSTAPMTIVPAPADEIPSSSASALAENSPPPAPSESMQMPFLRPPAPPPPLFMRKVPVKPGNEVTSPASVELKPATIDSRPPEVDEPLAPSHPATTALAATQFGRPVLPPPPLFRPPPGAQPAGSFASEAAPSSSHIEAPPLPASAPSPISLVTGTASEGTASPPSRHRASAQPAADASPLPVPLPPPGPSISVLPFPHLNQEALQAIFLTDEILDLPKVAQFASALPGVSGCMILTSEEKADCGEWPSGLDELRVREICAGLDGIASPLEKVSLASGCTLHGEAISLSFFGRGEVQIAVAHSPRGFLPGVREKLTRLLEGLLDA